MDQTYEIVEIKNGGTVAVVYVTLENLYTKLDTIYLNVSGNSYNPLSIENLGNNQYRLTFPSDAIKEEQGTLNYLLGASQVNDALNNLFEYQVYRHFLTIENIAGTIRCFFTCYTNDAQKYIATNTIVNKFQYQPGLAFTYTNNIITDTSFAAIYDDHSYSSSASTTYCLQIGTTKYKLTGGNWNYHDFVQRI